MYIYTTKLLYCGVSISLHVQLDTSRVVFSWNPNDPSSLETHSENRRGSEPSCRADYPS